MDADELDEAAFTAYLQRILQDLNAQRAQSAGGACRMCEGSGICRQCQGNGRLPVRRLGLVECHACIGDGACITCSGTGEQRRG